MGTSARPVRRTMPDSAKTFVPLLPWVPIEANQSAPRSRISGRFASISTLLMTMGLPKRPLAAGKGGRGRGIPRFPSMLWIRVVSSPQTNAPALGRQEGMLIQPREPIPQAGRPIAELAQHHRLRQRPAIQHRPQPAGGRRNGSNSIQGYPGAPGPAFSHLARVSPVAGR